MDCKVISHPYDMAVIWVITHYPSTSHEEIQEAQEIYFGHPIEILRQVSLLSKNRTDAMAWDIHEIVESLEYYREGNRKTPDWTRSPSSSWKMPYHLPACKYELQYLRQEGEMFSRQEALRNEIKEAED